jgi:thiosulfate/3-mercaptopyruvate sulfurtransferase
MNTQAAITVSELAQHLHHPRLVILDCRYDLTDPQAGADAYRQSHIPGARYASLHQDLSGPAGRYGGRHPLPSSEQFQHFARTAGINADSQVVLYDDQRLAFAARAWWLLRYFGHEQVAILNGGFSAWHRAGLPLEEEREAKPRATGNFACQPRANALIDHDQLYSNLDNPPWQLIDARDALRYAGIEEPLDRIAGHIPTAINKPWKKITDDQGMIKSREQLLAHWQDIPADEQLVNYCGSGVTACVNLFSLHLIGRDGAQLYPGSWSDWCAHIVYPCETVE